MIRAALRTVCAALVIVGLAWIYTLFYGGPFGPIFAWATHFLPVGYQYTPVPVPIKPLTG